MLRAEKSRRMDASGDPGGDPGGDPDGDPDGDLGGDPDGDPGGDHVGEVGTARNVPVASGTGLAILAIASASKSGW